MNYKYNSDVAAFEGSIDYNVQTICQCGCGEFAPHGEAYIKGHYDAAHQLMIELPRQRCECGCGHITPPGKKFIEGHEQNPFIRNSRRMYENKECSAYLGIVVAEQVLSKVFKNVEMMRNGNPGFDFICNGGYLIDSKCSTICSNGDWKFNINCNKIADYFALLAFDNRDSLTPQHLWLIPGYVLNHLKGTSISKSTTSKWAKYEQPIDRVIECCNTMR